MQFLTQVNIAGLIGQAIDSEWIVEIDAFGDRTGNIFWSGAQGATPSKSATVADVAQIAAAGSVIPDWLPNHAYNANDVVRATVAVSSAGIEVGDILRRKTVGSSTATFNAAEAASWDELGAQIVKSVAGKSGDVLLVKGDVGLGSVDNTTDATKPVSTAQQTALNAKEPTIVTLPLTKGGTGSGTAAGARTSLGLGDSATRNVGSAAGTVSAGDDARLSDARAPTAHTHAQSEITNLVADLAAKQATLVSGTNIKTVGGASLVGSGNVAVAADLPGGTATTVTDEGLDAGNAVIDRATVPGETILRYATTGAASTFKAPLGVTSVRALVVGGGGGGGGTTGAGGGAGGMKDTASVAVTPGSSIAVAVGAGGAGAALSATANGLNGGASSFGALSAVIGGGGGGTSGAVRAGNSGGSGGGGTGGVAAGGAGTVGEGNAGGGSGVWSGGFFRGGGGGGAGAAALLTSSTVLGHGGIGLASDISGVSTLYAGGGGGGTFGEASPNFGIGGSGVGGNGSINGNGSAGAANKGGGGGGAGNNAGAGGAGGSGVVIIRFASTTRSYQALQAHANNAAAVTAGRLVGEFFNNTTTGGIAQVT